MKPARLRKDRGNILCGWDCRSIIASVDDRDVAGEWSDDDVSGVVQYTSVRIAAGYALGDRTFWHLTSYGSCPVKWCKSITLVL